MTPDHGSGPRSHASGAAEEPGGGTLLFLFESATLVLWAEEVAREAGIPVEVVPAPPGGGDLCALALQGLRRSRDALEALLEKEGIGYVVRA